MATQRQPNWMNIGRALVTHGFCYMGDYRNEFGMTLEQLAELAELMIFSPKMEIGAGQHNGLDALILIRFKED